MTIENPSKKPGIHEAPEKLKFKERGWFTEESSNPIHNKPKKTKGCAPNTSMTTFP